MLQYIITILIALIAALIALLQVKLNIITSARIKWVESLRNLISEYCAVSLNIALGIKGMPKNDKGIINIKNIPSDTKTKHADFIRQHDLVRNKILLHLNPDILSQKKLELLLTKNDALFSDYPNIQNITKAINDSTVELMVAARVVLTEEWNRSKRFFKYW